ncbi:hypothetical protein VP01_1794g3, partial [Puccinia sorghi]
MDLKLSSLVHLTLLKSGKIHRNVSLHHCSPIQVYEVSNTKLTDHISTASLEFYFQQGKELRVRAVFNQVEGWNTFIFAGTGFRKSRIPKLYHMKMIVSKFVVVIFVLNPLVSLADNQALEKFKAEIILKIKMFQEDYYSLEFQNLLALILVDEEHMKLHKKLAQLPT